MPPPTMIVDVAKLTRCEVVGDGKTASLALLDATGTPVRVLIGFEHAAALLMTLPRLLQQLLRLKHADPSLRLVYPVARWSLEQATDGDSLILSLTTPDGFSAAFGVRPGEIEEMAELSRRAEAGPTTRN